ncbi:hypothetical protein CEXT_713891 [Caerostris extrusa]|uniref:Uncharacterized protein n=1 Tax=Caerostris extrusa TaxID=172846 RepID=A0AAV4SCD9_CAEEX|nr:hypothetical protein CEXT_713891 [Caerostris extrusa]
MSYFSGKNINCGLAVDDGLLPTMVSNGWCQNAKQKVLVKKEVHLPETSGSLLNRHAKINLGGSDNDAYHYWHHTRKWYDLLLVKHNQPLGASQPAAVQPNAEDL